MKFEELGLNPKIVSVLTLLGYVTPTPIQEQAIPPALINKDVVGRSETGSGKTLAFALPIIQNIDLTKTGVQCLVVCPTRELANQGAGEIMKVTSHLEGIRVAAVYGGTNIQRQIMALKKHPQIVVGTPGRIMDHLDRKTIKFATVKTVILDEADEMLNMGFREDIETILKTIPTERQTMLFSATMPAEIKSIIKKYLHDEVMIEIGQENKALDKMDQFVASCKADKKMDTLLYLLENVVKGKTIVFANTKRSVEKIHKYLSEAKYDCQMIHGDMRQSARSHVMRDMHESEAGVLIATDVAARGIDIKDIKYVVNYDIPTQHEFYVHRVGRTARAGESGKIVNIISTSGQMKELKEIQKMTQAKLTDLEIPNAEQHKPSDEKSERRPSGSRFNQRGRSGFSSHREHSRFGERREGRYDRKPRGERSEFSDRKPSWMKHNDETAVEGSEQSGERKPFERSERKPFGRKPFGHGDRKPFGSRPFGRKPFGSRDRKPFDHSENAGEQTDHKPFEKSEGFEKSTEHRSYDRSKRSFGHSDSRKPYGERKSYGDRKSFGDRKSSFGRDEDKSFEKKEFGDRKRSSDRPYGEKRSSDRPFGERRSRPFGKSSGRSRFGEKKPYFGKRERRDDFAPKGERGERSEKNFLSQSEFNESKQRETKKRFSKTNHFGMK